MTVWAHWRACPVCRAGLGEPCRARSGLVRNGRPDGVMVELLLPHKARQRRTTGGGEVMTMAQTCTNCGGSGRDMDQVCALCGGSGTLPDPKVQR